ncbi:hypothetical protein HZI73_08700 [Vallitalea pronyensis]|uniref:Uncharacterized protein n=1 Tax=Vallitalea pronyensis TaxID=1348613 RepID=A0A8J8SG47_9FIRM|nr:hypothetical protein [Vallitalea pronyensis]QUI22375.1 hypothetical protein HZI73_08700 [Vallitalea pronyensis]
MNWYIFGGVLCVLYAMFVYYIGFKKPPTLIKIVKMKIKKTMSDQSAVIVCYVFGTIVLIVGIVLFVLGAR